jgi:hypothetical protein
MTDTFDIGKVEGAIYQTLFRDTVLYALVNGKIFTGLELEDVPARLTSAEMALVSVNYVSDLAAAFHGSGTSHLGNIKGDVQVDIASRKNKALVRQCVASVIRLLYNNCDITVGSRIFHLVIDDMSSLVRYTQDISAFQGTVKVPIYYEALLS